MTVRVTRRVCAISRTWCSGCVRAAIHIGSGRGLAGLRDRVALFDGTLSAGKANGAGWCLEATIPLATPQRP